MESLNTHLLVHLSEYLDTHSVCSLRLVSKRLNSSLDYYYTVKLNKKAKSTIRTDALFDYNYKIFSDELCLNLYSSNARQIMFNLMHALRHPMRCILRGVESSSHDYEQDIHSTYNYLDSYFWSSLGSTSENANEFLIFELKTISIIFEVQFRNYRAMYQGGYLFPSKQIQVKIGNEINNWHYESEILPVEFTEELQHIFLLPNVVFGKYVKIELIGKITTQTTDDLYYSVLDFVDIIGFSANNLRCKELIPLLNDYLPEMTTEFIEIPTDLQTLDSIPPFELFKHLTDELLQESIRALEADADANPGFMYRNDIFVLLLLKRNLIDEDSHFIKNTRHEIIADELYSRQLYEKANSIYIKTGNGRKLIKTLLTMGKYNSIVSNYLKDHPLLPKLEEIKQMAIDLGDQHYQGFVAALIQNGRS